MEDPKISELFWLIVSGASFMLLMAVLLIVTYQRHQRKLLRKEMQVKEVELKHSQSLLEHTILVQEQERSRIAKDLHDEIGNTLNITRMNIARLKPMDDAQSPLLITQAKTLIDAAIESTRRISHDLLPPTLETLGLVQAFKELFNDVDRSGAMHTKVEMNEIDEIELDRVQALGLFRIVQELVTNTIKHAGATQVHFYVDLEKDVMTLIYKDDGCGFDPAAVRENGLGWHSIENRGQMIGAAIHLESGLDKGIKVIIELKLKEV